MKYPLLLSCCFALCASVYAADSELGRKMSPERRILADRVTGRTLITLTDAPSNDMKIYQTHPQWASDGVHIIFRSSDRNPAKTPQAYAVNEITGVITQLTDGPDVDTYSLNVSRHRMELYFLRGKPAEGPQRLVVLDMGALLADSAAGTVKARDTYERVIATLPAEHKGAGGFDIDADESAAYFGVRLADAPPRQPGKPIPQVPGAIAAVDLKTGEYRLIHRTPFLMGHVQVNPWVPGEIIYCNETGGDAPQRIWTVRSDGTGDRPLFKETEFDWVTHEVVIDKDTVMFNLMGHTPELRKRPNGVFTINLRTDEVTNLGQTTRGNGFWHCNGTADGRWATADNFDGEVFLINRRSGEIALLSTGHMMRPDHTHPKFSPDGTRIIVQSGMLSGGKSLDLMIIPVPETAR